MEITRYEGYRIGHKVPVYDISEGGIYCSHWGLSDMYPECEKNLRWLLESGEDFRTEWCGCKKEIVSAQYERLNSKITVTVSQNIDSLYEEDALIYDTVREVTGEEIELDDDTIDAIRDAAWEAGIEDDAAIWDTLPDDATFEDCVAAADRLWARADGLLSREYELLKEIVGAMLDDKSIEEEEEEEEE